MTALLHASQKPVWEGPRAKESFGVVKLFHETEKQVLAVPYLQGS